MHKLCLKHYQLFLVQKNDQFLYGRRLTMITGHKPLLEIFNPKSTIPTLAAAQMHRWALVLSALDYKTEYKRSEDLTNCDALSRLPHEASTEGSERVIYSVSVIADDFPIPAGNIGNASLVDPVLSKVHQFVMSGWPEGCPDETITLCYNRRNELSCEQYCVLWGSRVIIPPVFRAKMLGKLHWEHPGTCGMKTIARTCMWWPKHGN